MSNDTDTSEAAILKRVFRPENRGWSAAAAEAILALGFDEADRVRMTELLEKAQAGALAEDEAKELENYRHIGKMLELLKSRARLSLNVSKAA